MWSHASIAAACILLATSVSSHTAPGNQGGGTLALMPHRIGLADGRTFDLNLPEGFDITVAAQGLHRVRFLARSPDQRIFVTDMRSISDNTRGSVYILDAFDNASGRFTKVGSYLTRLRNPNSIAFHTDTRGASWLYLALTDRLVRYAYAAGDQSPSSPSQTLATFPDYGLDYKYGGWHLTRTVAIGPNERIYISVGSSCNACEEKEAIRATVLEMDLDGGNQKTYATGLRNAVGMRWVGERLFATNMGADHLGDDRPDDTVHVVDRGENYGWPFCYPFRFRMYLDGRFSASRRNPGCSNIPPAAAAFPAHSSPLGLEYFDTATDARLHKSFLVALHGSSKPGLARGYRVVRVTEGAAPVDFVTGFLQGRRVNGRPTDILTFGRDGFLVTDDHAGVIYYVFRK